MAREIRTSGHRRRNVLANPKASSSSLEAGAMLGVSYMTLWRAIRENQFPGLQLRGRIIVPLKAVDLLLDTAVQSGELIDTAAWTANWRATAVAEPNLGTQVSHSPASSPQPGGGH